MILVLDGNNAIHRCDATTDLTTPDGLRVSGVFGTLRMIRALVNGLCPSKVIMTWDGGRSKRRMSISPEYKTRQLTSEEFEQLKLHREVLYQQMDILDQFLDCLGIPVIKVPKVEADDLIFVLASVYSMTDEIVVVVSTDMDYMQMVGLNDGRVAVYSPTREKLFDADEVVAHYGIRPDQIVDFKCLTGDGSDNISGVPGIGAKTAAQILQKYDTLAKAISEGKDELMKSKRTAKIFDHLAVIERNKQLVDLRNIDDATQEECLTAIDKAFSREYVFDGSKLLQLLMKYGFVSITSSYGVWSDPFVKMHG